MIKKTAFCILAEQYEALKAIEDTKGRNNKWSQSAQNRKALHERFLKIRSSLKGTTRDKVDQAISAYEEHVEI